MENNVTMVVNTCRSYSDIWPIFFSALDEYWQERSFDIILNSDRDVTDFTKVGVKVSCPNDGELSVDHWGRRLISTLEGIDSKYIILVFDDYILDSFVDNQKIVKILEFLEQDSNRAVYYLNSLGKPPAKNGASNEPRIVGRFEEYRLNSAPAIWRREDLIKFTRQKDTPWAWEAFGSYRTILGPKCFYAPKSSECDVYSYAYAYGGGIYRGKWVKEVILPKAKKYDLKIDFKKRGFYSAGTEEKRSWRWKFEFIALGFRMVGLWAIVFVLRALWTRFYGNKR